MLVNGQRRPTGREMLRIQGYPDSFKIVGNHAAIRKQAGNSVAVPVIRAIATQMLISLKTPKPVTERADQLVLF
jgi:DNA (cytosine-5)-methyltransferase 1